MNFLAHLYLSPPGADSRLGSLLGDFVKGPVERAGYNEEIRHAIRLHRAIDSFTDSHPAVLDAKGLFTGGRRRYAGILLDIFFDHCLAAAWDRHHAATLEAFAYEVYGQIEHSPHPLPERLGRMLPAMISQNWLVSYRSAEGLAIALERVSRRLPRAEPLRDAARELIEKRDAMREAFGRFFPDLVAMARNSP